MEKSLIFFKDRYAPLFSRLTTKKSFNCDYAGKLHIEQYHKDFCYWVIVV